MRSSGSNTTFNLSSSDEVGREVRSTARSLRFDPFAGYNFRIEISGLIVGGFTELSGLDSQVETFEVREGGVNHFVHQLPAQATQSNLVLTKGVGGLDALWNWYYDVTRGIILRKHGTVVLMSAQQIPVMWWNFASAYPVKWTGPQLDASGDGVAFQSFELVHEGLTQPLLSAALAAGQAIAGGIAGA
jgi:phage tail-like protein